MAPFRNSTKMARRRSTVRSLIALLTCAFALGLVTASSATAAGTAEIKIEGTGTVTSNPSGIDCTDIGGPTTGECVTTEFPFSFGAPNIELTAMPGPGFQFEEWHGSENVSAECNDGSTANPCMYDQGGQIYEITAVFGAVGPQQPLEVKLAGGGGGEVTSAPKGIECGTKCDAEFSEGGTVILTAAPNEHSTFAGWVGCGNVTVEDKCEVTMSEAKTVEASFDAIPQQALTVEKSGSGSGEVTSSPAGVECGSTCTVDFNEGASVVLTATASAPVPGARYIFAGWSGCDAVNGEGKCEVTMSEAKTVEAEFDTIPQQTIKVEKSGSGEGEVTSAPGGIGCGGACEAEFDEGTVVTLTATPTPGSFFAGWAGGGCSGAGACEVTLNAATTVTANFEPIPSPNASTGEATSITDTTATLEGLVDGQDYDTHYLVEYGETESYGSETPANNGVGEDAGVLATSTPVSVELSGLLPNTTYHYKIVAYNIPCSFFCPPAGPNRAEGADRTFTTLPVTPGMSTGVPVAVGADSATLAGEVIAQGAATTYHLEYGTSEALGASTPAQDAGSGTGGVYVTTGVEGLAPNTRYYYRFAASNSGGEGFGEIKSFITGAAGEPSGVPLPAGFALTGSALGNRSAIGFPNLTSLGPLPSSTPTTTTTTTKPLSKAQRLAKALAACKKDGKKAKRRRCEKAARAKYGPKPKHKARKR